ncbi:MAG: recombinase family protein, partial [Ruminococcus sp.]|nr:recombinase family protein [Ruminococcus sp.]
YTPERRTVNGKTGSVLVPSENAEAVRVAYELYQNESTSLKDIIVYIRENGINALRPTPRTKTGISNLDRSHLSRILENPLYVRADKEVYAYFSAKGYEMLDDVSDYDGIHGIFYHKTPDGMFIKLGYHEGLVDAKTWLAVQDKKSHNHKFPNNGKVMNSWLVGIMKCGNCGYAMHINHCTNKSRKTYCHFFDYGKYTAKGCKHTSRVEIRPDKVEEIVLELMRERIEKLVIDKKTADIPDSETESIRAEILRYDDEIRKLMDKLADADSVLFNYIQQRVSVLYEEKSKLETKLQIKSRKKKSVNTKPLEEPMSRWNDLTVQEKHALAVTMIDVVYISDENGVEVKFSI